MSGEDKALAFFGDNSNSLEVFETLKLYIGEFCPQARISVQDSLLAFRTNAGFAYVTKASDSSTLFDLAVTSRRRVKNMKESMTEQQIPETHSYIYHIPICSQSDIDTDVKNLIRQSYEYSKFNYA